MIINTFIQYIKSDKFIQLGYHTTEFIVPKHWFQFADDAAITTGEEQENQILLNASLFGVLGLKWRLGLKSARPSAFAKETLLVCRPFQSCL